MGLRRSLFLPLIGLLLFLAWLVLYSNDKPKEQRGSHDLPLSNEPEGGNFKLQSSTGEVTLDSFKGKVLMLYFGYASCPDICSTALSKMSLALQQLNRDDYPQVQSMFVSLDPERDSVERLKTFTQYFNPHFIGATTNDQQALKDMIQRYGVNYAKINGKNKKDHLINHSSIIYILNKEGEIKSMWPHTISDSVIVNSIYEAMGKTK